MQQASTHLFREAPPDPRVACIRLTRGSSAYATWVLEEGEGGTFLTIGSDPACEWRIRAASVPPHAVFVLLVGGAVYVRSGPQGGVKLDGLPLSETWQQVHADARLDVGLAQLEVKLSNEVVLPPLVDAPTSSATQPKLLHNPLQERPATPELSDPEQSGVRPSFTPELESRPEPSPAPPSRLSLLERLSRMSRISIFDAPSVLGRVPSSSRKLWPYMLGSVVLAAAYVAWLALLDS